MADTHLSRAKAAAEPLRTPRAHRNRGAIERALRQERIMRRRNFAGWLLTLLVAAGAGFSIVFWIAQQRTPQHPPQRSPTAATPTSIPAPPPDDEKNDPVSAGAAVHVLPAR